MTDTKRLDWLENNCTLTITRYKILGDDAVCCDIERFDRCCDTDAETLREAIDDAIALQANE